MSKFKAEDFLKDLGLELHVTTLERTLETTNNVYKLPVVNLSSDVAVMRVIDNLTATYGSEAVYSILKKLTHE